MSERGEQGERIRERFLRVEEASLHGIEEALGWEGPGAFHIPNGLSDYAQTVLLKEIEEPESVTWRDAGDDYINARGVHVVQNHEVFALKLSRGDQERVERVPYMHQLAQETEQLVQGLSPQYPSLAEWQADEMSYHKYYDAEVGLSYHRDNKRFPGLVVVVTLAGESDFQVIDRMPVAFMNDPETGQTTVTEWLVRNVYTIPVCAGSIVLMRAPGLLGESGSDELRPEHAVMNSRVLPRVSFILRANNKPDDRSYGFTYVNW